MRIDAIQKNRDLKRFGEPTGFDGFFWAAFSLLTVVSLYFFFQQANVPDSELARQGALAAQIRFLDPAGVWALSRYPVWHLSFAVFYQLGVPFTWSAAINSTLYLMLSFTMAQRAIRLHLGPESSFKLSTLAALVVALAAAVTVPGLRTPAISLPPLWQSPTLAIGFASSLLCLFYTAHCLYAIRERQNSPDAGNVAPSWHQAGILAALLLLSALSHPAFLWVFLPAWFVYLIALLIKHPSGVRAYLPMLAAALPAAACVALQLIGHCATITAPSLESVWYALRDVLLLAAFPLLALALLPRKESLRDPVIRLSLLCLAAGALEAALTIHSGDSASQGLVSAALILWIVMLPRFIDQVFTYRYERLRLQEDSRRGAVQTAVLARAQRRQNLKSFGFLAGMILLLWQVYTGVYALYRVFVAGGAL